MTEADWLTSHDPLAMLEFARGRTTDRKLRLFAVACCRRFPHLLTAKASALQGVAEGVAEGRVGSHDRKRARDEAFHVGWVSDPLTAHSRGPAKAALSDTLRRRAWEAADRTARQSIDLGTRERRGVEAPESDVDVLRDRESRFVADQLRCIVGNPFRAELVLPDDVGETTRGLATTVYEGPDFEILPILADALEERGCAEAVIAHCRHPGPHARGCWVVDQLLGKS